MTTDWQDWQPHPHMALAQYTQGVPIQRKPLALGSNSSAIAAGGNTDIVSAATVDQPSFQMLIGFNIAVAGTTIPFARLKFLWTDSASGVQVDPDWAILPDGAATLDFVHIMGPARGDILTVNALNFDPANIVAFTFGMSQTSHVLERLRVQEVGQPAVPLFTRPGIQSQLGVLASVGASVPASGQIDRIAATWAGRAKLACNNSAGTALMRIELLDPGVIAGASPLYGIANTGIIATLDVSASNEGYLEVELPNGPVVIREINTSTTAPQSPTTTLIRMD